MELDPLQKRAVELCLDFNNPQRTVAVSGAAGTGKTTIIKYIQEYLHARNYATVLCAPTGKAARRITVATGQPAVTIHRLLEYPKPGDRDPETGEPLDTTTPNRDSQNPLHQHVVIADEYAMVNYELDRNLIDALRPGGRLLVFGDENQLHPIEPHYLQRPELTPFQKLMKLGSVRLQHVFRQEEGSGILEQADRIRRGIIPTRREDFSILLTKHPTRVLQEFVVANQDAGINFRELHNQIIVPDRKSWIGTRKLNIILRDNLNTDQAGEIALPRYDWDKQYPVYVSVGDKVVCTENTYDMRDYTDRYSEWRNREEYLPYERSKIPTPDSKTMLNGETGIVLEIFSDGMIHIDMGDRIVEVPPVFVEFNAKRKRIMEIDPRTRIELAYALTTHKCQGSEYDNVVYVINRSIAYLLERRNFYTAVTRARNHVQVIADDFSMKMAMRAERPPYKKKSLS